MSLGFDLREARVNEGLSIRAAAEKIGVPPSVLFRAESGVVPHLRHAHAIAEYHGKQVTDIWPLGEPEDVPA